MLPANGLLRARNLATQGGAKSSWERLPWCSWIEAEDGDTVQYVPLRTKWLELPQCGICVLNAASFPQSSPLESFGFVTSSPSKRTGSLASSKEHLFLIQSLFQVETVKGREVTSSPFVSESPMSDGSRMGLLHRLESLRQLHDKQVGDIFLAGTLSYMVIGNER